MRFGYVRVSTQDQNLSRQLDGIKLDRVYEEKVSGASKDRKALTTMLESIRSGDEIYVHEMSRLGRSLIDLKTLVSEITNRGATLHFVTERMTFSSGRISPTDELMLNLLASFAQFERQLLKQRQAEGIAKAKEAGVYTGSTGRKPKLSIQQVKQATTLLAASVTKKEVAQILKVSRPTLDKALSRIKTGG